MFWYFGYGSNMDLTALRAKGVEPRSSEPALATGWRLRFNVQHFFNHEGGVGNIEPSTLAGDQVWGVLHLCEDEHLALLDLAEAHGHGYQRIGLALRTGRGEQQAIAYVGAPSFINDACRPTQRYLNILIQGAQAARLDPAYIEALRRQPVHAPPRRPPYRPPPGEFAVFDAESLARRPMLTALAGHVFDMSGARWQHHFLWQAFGGKDMTLFHLKRRDRSDGRETLDDIRHDRLDDEQRQHLNEFLHEYHIEYVYAGRFVHR